MPFSVYLRQAVENDRVIFPGDPAVYGFCRTCEEHKEPLKNGKRKALKCLECLKNEKEAFSFSAQYLNDPIDESAVEIKQSWLREFDFTSEVHGILATSQAYLTIDPAFRLNQSNDETGLVITKVGSDNFIYVLEAIGAKLNTEELIKEIFRLVTVYDIRKVGIETQGAQITLLHPIKQEMAKRNRFFTLEELKVSTRETKAARIRGLIPYYANGRVLHRRGLTKLRDQLIQFPRNVHDDVIDALAHQVPHWKKFKPGQKAPQGAAPYMSLNWFLEQESKPKSAMEALFRDFKKR